jgi:hypothetical protein
MEAETVAFEVVDALEALTVPYMIVGSLSSNAYGMARSTHDADFVIELGEHTAGEIVQRLGPGYDLDPQMSFESITATLRYRIRHRDSAFTAELFLLSDDPHDQERFKRRRHEQVGNRLVFLPTPEDVIVTKIRWSKRGARQKDVNDVRSVLRVQTGANLDLSYIRHWCDRHGTRDLFEQLLAGIP